MGANAGGAPGSADASSSPDDMGVSGTIQYADLAWTDLASSSTDMASPVTTTSLPPGTTVTGIWGTGADNLYLATDAASNAVYHVGSDGILHAQPAVGGLVGITGCDAQHIWAITVASVLFSAGDGTWTEQYFSDTEFLYVTGIWASGPNDIYATGIRKGGFGAIYHSTGDGNWPAQQAAGTRMEGVWGRSKSDVYAVGWAHQVFHTTGNGTWSDLTAQFSTGSFSTAWGNATDLFIAGPPIYRSHAGGAWTVDASSGTMTWDLRGIWGSASDNVWAVGTGGLLLHRDASGWTTVNSNTKSDLYAVWGTDATHVWIGGANVFAQLH
jgi:hypothetical protein